MSQNRRSNKEIMLLIIFTAVVCLGVLNFSALVELVKNFVGMIKPFLTGAGIAFVLNIPMKLAEEKWLSRMPEKLQKSKEPLELYYLYCFLWQ